MFKRITVIADRGMNSKENLVFLSSSDQHFLISYTLKKASEEIKEQSLSNDWQDIVTNSDGEIISASKVLDTVVKAKVALTEKEIEAIKEEKKVKKEKGRVPKYKTIEVKAKLHVSYNLKRAEKDAYDRERAIAKARKKLENGTASQAIKYGVNKYMLFSEELKAVGIDEDRISEEAKWDGLYPVVISVSSHLSEEAKWDGLYAIITDNTELTSKEVFSIYKTQWRIEECFRILKTDLNARPVHVYKDEHIYGHFILCYLALCMIRYLQYWLKTEHKIEMSASRIMDSIEEPRAVVIGQMPKVIIVPTDLGEDFLLLLNKLGFRKLETEMTPTRFKAITKLNLLDQLN